MTTAPNIRPAASLLVLRDAPGGVQVLLMRRPERDNDFRSGACVFPGGVVDAGDRAAHRWCHGVDAAQADARLGLAGGAGLDFFVAALRESFEEVGLLFACAADGRALAMAEHAESLRQWRRRLHRGEATLAQLCEHFDWRLDLRDTAYCAHWLTPVVRPKRFDTRFFMRLAPAGQQAEPDLGEALELMWLTPDEALDPARGLKLLNVTQRTLHDLRGHPSARAALAAAHARRGVQRILPRPVRTADGCERFVIPGQPAYDEVEALDPEGHASVSAELQPGDMTRLAPNLLRIAGVRRHAYVVGDERACAIVDADEDDAAAWPVLRAAAPAGVQWLLATGPEPPGAAVQRQWQAARALTAAALAGAAPLDIGAAQLRMLPLGTQHGLLLVPQAMLLAGDTDLCAAALPDVAWIAAANGFMRRSGAR